MARGRFLWDSDTQTFRPSHEVISKRFKAQPVKRSDLPTPMVIGCMDEVRSPINGRYYNDKAGYYRHVERAGCAIVGYDKNWQDHIKPRYDERVHEADIVADVKKSIEQVNTHGGAIPDAA
jgi:hypothetical protein